MKLCVVSFKECWCDNDGAWWSQGGFPAQMDAISSLFEEVCIVILQGVAQEEGIKLPETAEVIGLDKPGGVDARRKLSVLLSLRYYVRKIYAHIMQADVVHVPVPGDIAFLGMILAIICKKPLIARYGSSWGNTSNTTLMNRITKLVMRIFAGGRNVMLATGIDEVPPAPRMHWIFSTSISQQELTRIQPRTSRYLSAPPRFVYLGRLAEEKGVAYLINAIAWLKKSNNLTLPLVTIIGDGPLREKLRKLVELLECNDCIKFTGFLNRDEFFEFFSNSDLCIQPSLTEGFSKAWLDAMAHGLPVLSSNVGAAPFVVGDQGERGWLVEPGKVESLANQIKYILTAQIEWPAMRRRCREFVGEYTLENWAQRIGRICADEWGIVFENGKLVEKLA